MTTSFSQALPNQALGKDDELDMDLAKPSFLRSRQREQDGFAVNEDHSNWQNITIILENDVILGRGSRSNQPGNVKFRRLVKDNRFRYLAAPKVDKPKIAEEVILMWRRMNPPGRFLARKDEDEVKGNMEKKDEDAVWYDVGDKRAKLKASMALRERTPEAVEFLQVINKREEEVAKRNTMLVRHRLEIEGQFPDTHHSEVQQAPTEHVYDEALPLPPYSPPPLPPPPSRRASFAGFSQARRDSNSYVPYRPPSSMPLQQYHSPQPPLQQATRRSSLLGPRQAQLYMMQQTLQSRRHQIQQEIDFLEIEDRMDRQTELRMRQRPFMGVGSLPSIPDARESEHSQEDPIYIHVHDRFSSHPAASSNVAQSPIMPGQVHSQPSEVQSFDSEYYEQDLMPLHPDHNDEAGQILPFDKYHNLLQEWAEGETQSSKGGSDWRDGEDMDSVSTPRNRGVDRTISGCSMQSNTSELMAMSIISSGLDDSFVSMDKSGHSVIAFDP